MSEKTTPPDPKPAATILLLREGSAGMEVFMVVRHHQIDFASGALVFPGGKADPQDFDDALIPFLELRDFFPQLHHVFCHSFKRYTLSSGHCDCD